MGAVKPTKLKKYGVSVKYGVSNMITKKWKAEWKGLEIEVQNGWDLLFRGREALLVSGEVKDDRKSWFGFSQNLHADVVIDGMPHVITAHIGSMNWGLSVGCKISVDGEEIGGDLGKTFLT